MRGENYKKWAIYENGKNTYIDPEQNNLKMYNCTLKNNYKRAKRIFEGEPKDVCAWIECEKLIVTPIKKIKIKNKIRYNPKVKPFWFDENQDNIDGCLFEKIITYKTKLSAKKKEEKYDRD